jgi:hypothetical protein|uniref:Uncharacterized protein n=1 Tax=Picea glauca TaxID=3330 RepID=A0A101M0W8_PICGL|nr:hypothetical protein ABT39_MTgene4330 [Picea glauca]QHR88456.1 hypothetical protein Q903MT_gene2469 [Picea sitchensis]
MGILFLTYEAFEGKTGRYTHSIPFDPLLIVSVDGERATRFRFSLTGIVGSMSLSALLPYYRSVVKTHISLDVFFGP